MPVKLTLPDLRDYPPGAVLRKEDMRLTGDPGEADWIEYTRLINGNIAKVLEPVGINKAVGEMFEDGDEEPAGHKYR